MGSTLSNSLSRSRKPSAETELCRFVPLKFASEIGVETQKADVEKLFTRNNEGHLRCNDTYLAFVVNIEQGSTYHVTFNDLL